MSQVLKRLVRFREMHRAHVVQVKNINVVTARLKATLGQYTASGRRRLRT